VFALVHTTCNTMPFSGACVTVCFGCFMLPGCCVLPSFCLARFNGLRPKCPQGVVQMSNQRSDWPVNLTQLDSERGDQSPNRGCSLPSEWVSLKCCERLKLGIRADRRNKGVFGSLVDPSVLSPALSATLDKSIVCRITNGGCGRKTLIAMSKVLRRSTQAISKNGEEL
jgi:hypothetical protein